MNKPKLVMFVDYFLPGYKSGGPVQSVANLALILRQHYDIFIVTRDRDYQDQVPYPGIVANEWVPKDSYQIMYCPPTNITIRSTYKLLRSLSVDFIYTNSLFGRFTHHLLLITWLTNRRLIVAPRGELLHGALTQKYYKKYLFIQLVKIMATKCIKWHATNADEAKAIKSIFPKSKVGLVPVVMAPDTPRQLIRRMDYQKRVGRVKLVFMSRITPHKGLCFLAEVLKGISDFTLELDIYGPIGDPAYWHECQKRLADVSENCTVQYKGILDHSQVNTTLAGYDYFVLPTLGENFGHAIFEAFSVGLPVLISDQTQWRQLESRQAGWDIPLRKEQWIEALQKAVDIDSTTYNLMSTAARAVAETYMEPSEFEEKYRALFS